jgi:hypothetical protein
MMHKTSCLQAFFIVSWTEVRLSPLGTSATVWPIVPAPMMNDDECGAIDGRGILSQSAYTFIGNSNMRLKTEI